MQHTPSAWFSAPPHPLGWSLRFSRYSGAESGRLRGWGSCRDAPPLHPGKSRPCPLHGRNMNVTKAIRALHFRTTWPQNQKPILKLFLKTHLYTLLCHCGGHLTGQVAPSWPVTWPPQPCCPYFIIMENYCTYSGLYYWSQFTCDFFLFQTFSSTSMQTITCTWHLYSHVFALFLTVNLTISPKPKLFSWWKFKYSVVISNWGWPNDSVAFWCAAIKLYTNF